MCALCPQGFQKGKRRRNLGASAYWARCAHPATGDAGARFQAKVEIAPKPPGKLFCCTARNRPLLASRLFLRQADREPHSAARLCQGFTSPARSLRLTGASPKAHRGQACPGGGSVDLPPSRLSSYGISTWHSGSSDLVLAPPIRPAAEYMSSSRPEALRATALLLEGSVPASDQHTTRPTLDSTHHSRQPACFWTSSQQRYQNIHMSLY